jgi:hypothetical protein
MLIYSLSSIPYYNPFVQEYRNILILNKIPEGPLKDLCIPIRPNKLSVFESNTTFYRKSNCVIALKNNKNNRGFELSINNRGLLCIDELPNLFEFLINNGYTVDQSITKVFQKTNVKMNGEFICIIKY